MTRHCIIPAAQRAGSEARTARANQKATELAPIIAELRAAGITESAQSQLRRSLISGRARMVTI